MSSTTSKGNKNLTNQRKLLKILKSAKASNADKIVGYNNIVIIFIIGRNPDCQRHRFYHS